MELEHQAHPREDEEIVVDAQGSVEAEDRGEGGLGEQTSTTGDSGLATPPLDMEVEKSKVSRKREREVSLEPSTPQATSIDIDVSASAQKDRDRRTPAKKNRTSAQLDATAEQDEDGQDVLIFDESEPASRSTPPSRKGSSRTPPLQDNDDTAAAIAAEVSASPPHETKIRLISRGVEDLNWRSLGGASSKLAFEAPRVTDESNEMDHEDEESSSKPKLGHESTSVEMAVLSGPNPPVVDDEPAAADEHGGGADPVEAPPTPEETQLEPTPTSSRATPGSGSPGPFPRGVHDTSNPSLPPSPPPEDLIAARPSSRPQTASGSPRTAPLLPSPWEDDVKSGQKRKLGDRSVSERHIPGDIGERKGKRASPPPSTPTVPEEAEEKTEKQERQKPQLTGFMAYASSSSPFSSVKGPNLFSSSSTSSLSQSRPSSAAWSPSTANYSPPTSASPFSFTPSTSPAKAAPSSVASTPASAVTTSSTSMSILSPSVSASSAHSTPQANPPQKRTGFEAFASTASPFASAAKRPKSPPPSFASPGTPSGHGHTGVGLGFGFGHLGKNGKRQGSPARNSVFGSGSSSTAFSAYATGGSAFGHVFGSSSTSTSSSASSVIGNALDPPAREGSPLNGVARTNIFGGGSEGAEQGSGGRTKVSFGERLRAEKDTEEEEGDEAVGGNAKVELTEQEILTGEEDEETVYQARGKLFALSDQNQWKEKGTGNLRLNVRRADGSGARLIMRKEAVYTVLLNAPLFAGMQCSLAQDPRYLRFTVVEQDTVTSYNLRVSNARIAEDLLDEINQHIPQ